MQLEKEFFASQPLTIQPRPIGLLVVDFDETVTLADTTGCIANAVIDVAVSKVICLVGLDHWIGLLLVGAHV